MIVGLDGKEVDGVIPRDDRPEDVLEKLLTQIRDGSAKVQRLMVIVEGTIGDSDNSYFTRTSLATNSEALALTVIGQRIISDTILRYYGANATSGLRSINLSLAGSPVR